MTVYKIIEFSLRVRIIEKRAVVTACNFNKLSILTACTI